MAIKRKLRKEPDLQTTKFTEQLQEETSSSKTKNRGRPRKPNVTTSTNDFNEDVVAASSPSTTTETTVQPPAKKARKSKSIKSKTKAVKEKTKVSANEWADDTYPINIKEQLRTSNSGGKGGGKVAAALAIKIGSNKKGAQATAQVNSRNAIIIPSDIPEKQQTSSTSQSPKIIKPRKWNRKKVVIRTTGGEIAMPVWYSTEQRQILRNISFSG
ncbi:1051_t:CDS:2 [Ambispora gerdemannii]|uniref:1051_t:CDS:1 n=1 Tax=Ambispora gerdemannii TaxID=144530 RepID=A0A9N9DNB6_9GLOM|nr:1051_t:CDS:2 [Ambispora gerdemannii]